MRSSRMAKINLKDCFLPEDALLGRCGAGMGVTLSIMRWERSCILAGFLGALERDLVRVTSFLCERRDSKGSLMRHQGVSHKLAHIRLRIESARWLMYRAAWDLDHGTGPILYPALSKLSLSQTLVDCGLELQELMAGSGWMDELGIATALHDVVGTLSASGTSNVQLNIISSQLKRE